MLMNGGNGPQKEGWLDVCPCGCVFGSDFLPAKLSIGVRGLFQLHAGRHFGIGWNFLGALSKDISDFD
jgi:hypothetical protein